MGKTQCQTHSILLVIPYHAIILHSVVQKCLAFSVLNRWSSLWFFLYDRHILLVHFMNYGVIRVTLCSIQFILSDQYCYMRYNSKICTIMNKLVKCTIYKETWQKVNNNPGIKEDRQRIINFQNKHTEVLQHFFFFSWHDLFKFDNSDIWK